MVMPVIGVWKHCRCNTERAEYPRLDLLNCDKKTSECTKWTVDFE